MSRVSEVMRSAEKVVADNELFFSTRSPRCNNYAGVILIDAHVDVDRSRLALDVNQRIYRNEVTQRTTRSTTDDLDQPRSTVDGGS